MTKEVHASKYRIRAVSVATKLLGALADRPRQTMSQLAAQLDLTGSLCYRMLATLEAEGLVYRDQYRQYSLGSRTMYLGYQAQRSLPLNEIAEPVMSRLVEETTETVHLVLRDRLERVIVAMKESPQPVRVSTPIGTKFPMYYGGTGLCMFAYLTREEQDEILSGELVPKTRGTVRDADRIREIAGEIRERGYHVALGDFADSAFSIAAPVFGTDGVVIGSICVVGPESRLDRTVQARIVELVVKAGAVLSAALGSPGEPVSAIG
jgi:IclR family KDG regulon transcriptional repressor